MGYSHGAWLDICVWDSAVLISELDFLISVTGGRRVCSSYAFVPHRFGLLIDAINISHSKKAVQKQCWKVNFTAGLSNQEKKIPMFVSMQVGATLLAVAD